MNCDIIAKPEGKGNGLMVSRVEGNTFLLVRFTAMTFL